MLNHWWRLIKKIKTYLLSLNFAVKNTNSTALKFDAVAWLDWRIGGNPSHARLDHVTIIPIFGAKWRLQANGECPNGVSRYSGRKKQFVKNFHLHGYSMTPTICRFSQFSIILSLITLTHFEKKNAITYMPFPSLNPNCVCDRQTPIVIGLISIQSNLQKKFRCMREKVDGSGSFINFWYWYECGRCEVFWHNSCFI